MSFLEILLLAVGLSMDSLAVSVTSGAVMKECSVRRVVKIAFVLAFFQAMFTLVGYLLGFSFLKLIETIDHWIAFGLLLYLGGRMIWESRQEKEEDKKMNPLCLKTLCGLGIATSIDALAVGVSLAIMQTSLSVITWTIGIVTFLFSSFGVCFGVKVGNKVDLKLDLIGGVILIGIGVKILIEHLLGF
ncbi:MAG: manganese efflux pump [Parabacteroides sp.]|nr:manganese efflux pump [Parabacteroides sp.]